MRVEVACFLVLYTGRHEEGFTTYMTYSRPSLPCIAIGVSNIGMRLGSHIPVKSHLQGCKKGGHAKGRRQTGLVPRVQSPVYCMEEHHVQAATTHRRMPLEHMAKCSHMA